LSFQKNYPLQRLFIKKFIVTLYTKFSTTKHDFSPKIKKKKGLYRDLLSKFSIALNLIYIYIYIYILQDFKKSEELLQKGKKEHEKRLKSVAATGGSDGGEEALAELRGCVCLCVYLCVCLSVLCVCT